MIKKVTYNKLVRDKIPEMISKDKDVEGFGVSILKPTNRHIHLQNKLKEEVEEYFNSNGSIDELVDVCEVIFSIAKYSGINKYQLLDLIERKCDKNGGFEKFYFLTFIDREVSE